MNGYRLKDSLEIIGVVAIIVSLGFVTYEIRQNTNAVRSTVIHSISQQSFDAIALVIENKDLRKAQDAVIAGIATQDELRLSDLFYTALLRVQLNRFFQSEIGVIDREMVLAVGGRRGGAVYRRREFVDFWARNRDDYTESFQSYMDQYVGIQ